LDSLVEKQTCHHGISLEAHGALTLLEKNEKKKLK
jgi:hypothetical protein